MGGKGCIYADGERERAPLLKTRSLICDNHYSAFASKLLPLVCESLLPGRQKSLVEKSAIKKEWERRGSPDSKKKSRSSAAAASAGGGGQTTREGWEGGGGKGETSRRPKQMLEWEGEGRKEGAFFFSFPRSKLSALERRRGRRSALPSPFQIPSSSSSPSQARRRRRRRRRASKAAPPPLLLGRAPSCLSPRPVLVLEVSGGERGSSIPWRRRRRSCRRVVY